MTLIPWVTTSCSSRAIRARSRSAASAASLAAVRSSSSARRSTVSARRRLRAATRPATQIAASRPSGDNSTEASSPGSHLRRAYHHGRNGDDQPAGHRAGAVPVSPGVGGQNPGKPGTRPAGRHPPAAPGRDWPVCAASAHPCFSLGRRWPALPPAWCSGSRECFYCCRSSPAWPRLCPRGRGRGWLGPVIPAAGSIAVTLQLVMAGALAPGAAGARHVRGEGFAKCAARPFPHGP
jgi:hypothetical protein